MENAWSNALGIGPFTGSQFELSIAENHLADHDVMYTGSDGT